MNNPTDVSEQFDVFLSHSGVDKDWVKNLGERLENEHAEESPNSRKIKVFLDDWDIDYSENIVNRLNVGLQKSRYLAAILSPEFLDSGWANQEWTHWFMSDPKAPNLLPVLLRSVSLDGKRRIDLPMPFKTAKHFDFRENNRFESEFKKLLRRIRGQRPARGTAGPALYCSGEQWGAKQSPVEASWDADRVEEMILSNLIEVKNYPDKVWSGSTTFEKPPEVWEQVPNSAPFILRDKKLWTLEDLSGEQAPLRAVVDVQTITTIEVTTWVRDPAKARYLVALFNQVLKNRLGKLGIKRDLKGRFYFKSNADGTPRKFTNAGDRERNVAAKKISADGNSSFFVHFAAFAKFERLGDKFFILVEPGYVFTEDGEKPLTPKATGKLAVQWGGQQRNDTIFRNVLFWIKLIANSGKEYGLITGGLPITISGVPAAAKMNRGIEGDETKIGALLNIGSEADEVDDLEEAAQNAEVVLDEGESDEAEEGI